MLTLNDEMRALDERIAGALEIPVPELRMPDLPDIDTGNVTTLKSRRLSPPAWLAMAATIAAVAILGYTVFDATPDDSSLADQIIAHMDHEPYAFRNTDTPVSDGRLARVVPANIATMDHNDGLITYAQSCVINGNTVPHLVIQGEHGPVTILLMPEEEVEEAQEIRGESVNGIIIPIGSGSIAIIGDDSDDLRRMERNVRDSVTFST